MGHRMRRAQVIPLIAAALLLAGCTSNPVGPRASTTPYGTASPTSTPAVTTPRPSLHASSATPVTEDCSGLVPRAALDDVAKGYEPVVPFTPAAGSNTARIAAIRGATCEWRDLKTGHTLLVGVAHPSAKDLLALKNDLVDRSNSVPTFKEEGYFRTVDGSGAANAFHGDYWINAVSPDFYEPGDASAVMAAVGRALDGR